MDNSFRMKAVFLSYAREDSGAAQHIAEALRAFGVEVWFDQSELRGGDAWDQKIRRQIKECTLFVPLVSAATQERGEGYFRLEWKLAVDRSHLMAEGVPFLMPIAVGGQTDAGALVPAEFLKVQWTVLPDGEPTPALIDQVKRLLAGGRAASTSASTQPAAKAPSPFAPKKSRLPVAWIVAAATVFVACAAIFAVWSSRRAHTDAAVPNTASAPAPPNDKSIAVLPFTNMSDEKDSGFFADGIHEDILTHLALIHDLRVVSRTSVEQYRNTTKPIREIGQDLHVAYILEGSVQREGNRVRVTGQLIRADTDEHVWAQAYDRDLTDIFAIQSELSQAIANALETQLSPQEQTLIAQRPTANIAAYDLLLKARQVEDADDLGRNTYQKATSLLRSAVELDPTYARAWGELADTLAQQVFEGEASDSRANLAEAKAAIARAQTLAADDPDVIGDVGTYYYYGFRDYARAADQYRRLGQLQPNDPQLFNSLGLIERRQGRWRESIAHSRRAVALDPGNAGFLRNLRDSLIAVGHGNEAIEAERKYVALTGNHLLARAELATSIYGWTGSTSEMDAVLASMSPDEAASEEGVKARLELYRTRGDMAQAVELDRAALANGSLAHAENVDLLFAARDFVVSGDTAATGALLPPFIARLTADLASDRDDVMTWAYLAVAQADMGNAAECERCIRQIETLMPMGHDAVLGPLLAVWSCLDRCQLGDLDGAIAGLRALLGVPNALLNIGLTPYNLQTDVTFYWLRRDPRAKEIAKLALQPLD